MSRPRSRARKRGTNWCTEKMNTYPVFRRKPLVITPWILSLLLGLVWIARGQPPVETLAATATIDLGGGVTMEFVLIRPGSFKMGSDRNDYDEKPVHKVTLTQPYYLGKYEVTQEQWERVMGNNPSHFKGAKLPVENVSWEDCQRFIRQIGEKVGRKFALPTEAQWEYACRAGTTTQYSCGDDPAVLDEYAWHAGNSELKTHPVGRKKPNPWGLYDMHGNVFEWCQDWYAESYPEGDATDPTGAPEGDRRVIRGGAWLYVIDNLRSADRGFSPPEYRINEYGLRCVMQVHSTSDPRATVGETANAQTRESAHATGSDSFAQVETAVKQGNKLRAELLLGEAEQANPGDARLGVLRDRLREMSSPKESLGIEMAPGVKMEFVLIRPGSFTMGSDQSPVLNERPAHRVTITAPFYLGKFEVTQKQWTSIMDRNLSAFKGASPGFEAADLPVENVSWLLCQNFFSELSKKVPGYTFRLPTEAEWEYACRAGATTDSGLPEGASLADYAWFGENAGGQTHPVGSKKPNAWGLYDMLGNVWEWCHDEFGSYAAEAARDPEGASFTTGGMRVLRGGAWNNIADHVNAHFRHDEGSAILMRYYGFRCVAVPNQSGREQAR